MKAVIFCLTLLHGQNGLAQGTIYFSGSLYSLDPQLPEAEAFRGRAEFNLSADGELAGHARFEEWFPGDGVQITDVNKLLIRSASSIVALGDPTTSAPSVHVLATWDPQQLNQSEITRLLAGEFYVYVPSSFRPLEGEIFGQIEVVPEPTAFAILGSGILFLCSRARRSFSGRIGPV